MNQVIFELHIFINLGPNFEVSH